MKVSVIGTGYVGLVTGACMARIGHDVTCLDSDAAKIATLRGGKMPIFEPGLDELVAEMSAAGRLRFTADPEEALPQSDALFICVGTPSGPDGRANMAAVQSAATTIGQHLNGHYTVIITKSTVPIGSGDWVGALVREGVRSRARAAAGGGVAVLDKMPQFDVVSNPEFLREGTAVEDCLHPDRIVVGADNERAVGVMRRLYQPLVEHSWNGHKPTEPVPFEVMDRASAEMVKYAANAFLATKISFINEISGLCERVGADVRQVSRGIGLDRRIGQSFLSAGIGWGGSCFPKDLASLTTTAADYECHTPLLQATVKVNAEQRQLPVRKLQERLKVLAGKTVALWGLAFKPHTDDLRDAPALEIAQRLIQLGVRVRAYDPVAMPHAERYLPGVELCDDLYATVEDADAILLVTEWPQFLQADWDRVRQSMRRALVVDGRNALDHAQLLFEGFEVAGIGC